MCNQEWLESILFKIESRLESNKKSKDKASTTYERGFAHGEEEALLWVAALLEKEPEEDAPADSAE